MIERLPCFRVFINSFLVSSHFIFYVEAARKSYCANKETVRRLSWKGSIRVLGNRGKSGKVHWENVMGEATGTRANHHSEIRKTLL